MISPQRVVCFLSLSLGKEIWYIHKSWKCFYNMFLQCLLLNFDLFYKYYTLWAAQHNNYEMSSIARMKQDWKFKRKKFILKCILFHCLNFIILSLDKKKLPEVVLTTTATATKNQRQDLRAIFSSLCLSWNRTD